MQKNDAVRLHIGIGQQPDNYHKNTALFLALLVYAVLRPQCHAAYVLLPIAPVLAQ